jgi:hypothetical protein
MRNTHFPRFGEPPVAASSVRELNSCGRAQQMRNKFKLQFPDNQFSAMGTKLVLCPFGDGAALGSIFKTLVNAKAVALATMRALPNDVRVRPTVDLVGAFEFLAAKIRRSVRRSAALALRERLFDGLDLLRLRAGRPAYLRGRGASIHFFIRRRRRLLSFCHRFLPFKGN